MKLSLFSTFFALILILAMSGIALAEWQLDFETGPVFNGYNDVQIPQETGTRFSITDDLSVDTKAFFRGRISYILNEKHVFSLFAAPLRLNASGIAGKEIIFEGTTFPADTPLEAVYRFDSYRLTYRYNFYRQPDLIIGIGFTAKIRDAAISLESPDQFAEKTNTGFVPLINFNIDWAFAQRFGLQFGGDALAAPQGRAEDVLLALSYQAFDNLALKFGYRVLEGGADVDEVYNFALLHYVVFGATVSF
jgi:hypothetical protein